MVQTRFSENKINNCSICLDELKVFIKTECNHEFHKECLQNIKKPVCPLCRADIESFFVSNDIPVPIPGSERQNLVQRNRRENSRCCCINIITLVQYIIEFLFVFSMIVSICTLHNKENFMPVLRILKIIQMVYCAFSIAFAGAFEGSFNVQFRHCLFVWLELLL